MGNSLFHTTGSTSRVWVWCAGTADYTTLSVVAFLQI